ncbi:ankyrin-1-like [Leptopilina heterotoma]|uniref:ankyrin-1-like n=1 Tax=Leptopilina heterotoma TaxID=63436 RepID=UPI001CAA04DB|nr:ankyrin-1-like [Leptopilina heterotoma]XP_043483532.1 ankyrin-1-like [Leptopilina heterotoma]
MDFGNDYNDTSEYNELFLAVHNGELNLVHSLLKKYSATETIRGRTLLHVATARGHAAIAKLFTSTKRDGRGNTPLHLAIRENQPELFNLLLEDSNLNAKNLNDESPLHYTVLYNRPEFAKSLLGNGAFIEEKDRYGKTPLYVALSKGNVQMAEILFKHGAVLSDTDLTNMSPLRNAVFREKFEMVKLLMANGCNKVDIPVINIIHLDSCLELAVSSDRLDIVEYLIKNGVKSIATVKEDKLGLFRSLVLRGSLETLKCLVDIGIKVQNLDDVFNSTFYLHRHDMWKYLLTRLSKISANTYFKEMQLHFSIRMGQVETVKVMVNEPSGEYESNTFARKLAVYIAVESGSEEILKILLDAGYPVKKSLFKFISPLHLAATFEHPRLLKLLLEAGANVNLRTEDCGRTPLLFAATAAQPAVVKFLLENGADPFTTSKFGAVPLHEALGTYSGLYHVMPVTPLVFEELLKVTQMLIRYSNSKINEYLFSDAVTMRVSSINYSMPVTNEEISEVGDCVFRPEIVTCICNHLSNKKIKSCSEKVLAEGNSSYVQPPELLQLMMEYNDSESRFCAEINYADRNPKSQLLTVGYSKNVNILSNAIYEIYNDYDVCDAEDIWKNKDNFLKLIVCRIVLLDAEYDITELEECELSDLIDWREKCLMEKKVLQKTKVNKNLNFTFYSVLTESIDKVAMYTSNNDFLKEIESSDKKFPIYADLLKSTVEIAERRRNFINDCVNLMLILIQKCHKIRISRNEVNKIFKYLSILDLRRFSTACS